MADDKTPTDKPHFSNEMQKPIDMMTDSKKKAPAPKTNLIPDIKHFDHTHPDIGDPDILETK